MEAAEGRLEGFVEADEAADSANASILAQNFAAGGDLGHLLRLIFCAGFRAEATQIGRK